jgi:ferrous iron transport protein A
MTGNGHAATTTLDKLTAGQCGTVVDVDSSSALGRRLLELGLVPGRRARMLREAPLGDPIEIDLYSSYLSIRRYEASLVQMQLES